MFNGNTVNNRPLAYCVPCSERTPHRYERLGVNGPTDIESRLPGLQQRFAQRSSTPKGNRIISIRAGSSAFVQRNVQRAMFGIN